MSDKTAELLSLLHGQSGAMDGVDESGYVASGETDYALLSAGKISHEEFLELTVDRALSHLKDHVDEERLLGMREILIESLASDPEMMELAARLSETSAAAQDSAPSL